MTDSYEKALDKLVEYIDQTVTFAKGELPEIANQIAVYGAASASIWMTVLGIGAALAFLLFVLAVRASKENEDMDEDMVGVAILMFFITGVLVVFTVSQRMTLLKIEKAPKLYVLEQVRELARSQPCVN